MADTKPKWGWHMEMHGVPEGLDWEQIHARVDALNPGWLPQLKYGLPEVYAHIDSYYARKLDTWPTRAEVRAAAKVVQADVSRLLSKLNALDDQSRRSIGNYYSFGPDPLGNGNSSDVQFVDLPCAKCEADSLDELILRLERLEQASAHTYRRYRGQRAKRPNKHEALDTLIGGMADLYEQATSQPAKLKLTYDKEQNEYWSPFLDFLTDMLNLIDAKHGYTNNAIGDAARRFFGMR